MDINKKKYLFFYLKTGGGHLAPAKSLYNYINKYYCNEATPFLVDGFTDTTKIVKYLVEDGYRKLQAKAKWFYELLYALNKFSFFAKVNCLIISISTKNLLKKKYLTANLKKLLSSIFF